MEPLSSCMSLKSAESSSATEVAGYLYSHFCWAALVDTLDAIEPLCFQAGCHKRRLNLALVFLCLFCVVVFFVQCFDTVGWVAERASGKIQIGFTFLVPSHPGSL